MITKADKDFLALAEFWAGRKSKDPSTKVGAVVASPSGRVLTMGWNGFPRGVADTEERLNDRNQKLDLTVHAEINAFYNAAAEGVSLSGGTMYVSGLHVCRECAKGCIQCGIERIVMRYPMAAYLRWKQSCDAAAELLDEVGLPYEFELVNKTEYPPGHAWWDPSHE